MNTEVILHQRQSTPDEPDERLLAACRQGDRVALERVLRSFAPILERQLLRLCMTAVDVPDLLQQTLVGAVRSFPKFRGDSSLRTWLTSIAIKVVQEHARRPDHRRLAPLTLAASDGRLRDDAAPERLIESRRRLERLLQVMAKLNPTNRTAYILYEVEGMPVREVAEALRISVVAAKSRIFLARRALMKASQRDPELQELADELGGGLWQT